MARSERPEYLVLPAFAGMIRRYLPWAPSPVPASAGAGHAVGPVLFSGDTLFNGGPGATGRSHSSFETIIESIRDRLFTLPDPTVVLTGHGDSTSIEAEKPSLEECIKLGH